jgi:tetratricopeptide (TPR) repeat protein
LIPNNLISFRKLELYNEALPLYQRSLEILQSYFGCSHPDTSEILNNLGLILKKQSKYQEASENYNKALHLTQGIFGETHPRVAAIINNLADLKVGSTYLLVGR